MITRSEIIQLYNETLAEFDNFAEYETVQSGFKAQNASGPKMREVVKAVLERIKKLVPENEYSELLKQMKTQDDFFASLTEPSLEASYQGMPFSRRSLEEKSKLKSFAKRLAETEFDSKVIDLFASETPKFESATKCFSSPDEEFLYDAYRLRTITDRASNLSESYAGLSDAELKEIAENLYKAKIQKMKIEKGGHETFVPHESGDKTRQVALIIGAPGSGKSTFIKKLNKEGFFNLDLDDYAVAICQKKGIKISENNEKKFTKTLQKSQPIFMN